MKHGMYLVVYPEGTSSDGKKGILPFKSTPFAAAAEEGALIFPAIIRYAEPAGEPSVCWYGDMTLLPHAWHLLQRRRIDAAVRFLEPVASAGRSRRELASHVHGVMEREYARG